MPGLFIRQQFVISQVVITGREECDEMVEKLQSRENGYGIWLLNALSCSFVDRIPTEFGALCGILTWILAYVETQEFSGPEMQDWALKLWQETID